MTKQQKKTKIISNAAVAIAAVIGVVVIEVTALKNGIDGTMLLGSFVIVGGIGGWKGKDIIELYKG